MQSIVITNKELVTKNIGLETSDWEWRDHIIENDVIILSYFYSTSLIIKYTITNEFFFF